MTRYYIIVNGRVQGVGFRYRMGMLAADLNLTGWVRNLSNGMVDMEIQGAEGDVAAFLSELRRGRDRFIRIDDVSVKRKAPVNGEDRFRVRY